MLVKFSVENFRSIKEQQVLSMVKSNVYKELQQNTFTSNAPNTPELLKSAVIYGANASGKSNLLKALFVMTQIIETSFHKKLDEPIVVEPFLLDPKSRIEPTTFQISFIANLANEASEEKQFALVEYGFSTDKKIVYEEWLSVYPKGREQAWFHRIYDTKSKSYHWLKESESFKGSKSTWKENTRLDQLFLSTAVHLNSEQLKPIYNAIVHKLGVIGADRISNEFTKKLCKKEEYKTLFISFLQQADIDLVDIKLEKLNVENIIFPDEFLPKEIKEEIFKDLSEQVEVYFIHKDSLDNEVKINLREESDGTQKLFEFIGLIFNAMNQGDTLIIDEFNKSLHPDLVRYLVALFNSKHNKNNGQLIFTTHETSVLRKELLRRDQIWFCEKGSDRATNLYPLSDFSPLNREDLEESYLHGRYGGKPVIKEFIF
ncbi:ATP-binding protein [Pasteurella atlantica]|nr:MULTISPECIES: ATP-binding protein [Pasteurella]MDP8034490.1 ATP-binding protein [Pasteurella atlantica]MDP8036422.1 ATP-binding protein [Pasteurella atlantica]MDP8038375.1 ATP-binding protein [Pasteurella atlantica]MDP8048687.1 ATP-binding protein [Pasteurella atlantica]MDP8050658.1 ATP-binding protein [Pasteurella atlantica]